MHATTQAAVDWLCAKADRVADTETEVGKLRAVYTFLSLLSKDAVKQGVCYAGICGLP